MKKFLIIFIIFISFYFNVFGQFDADSLNKKLLQKIENITKNPSLQKDTVEYGDTLLISFVRESTPEIILEVDLIPQKKMCSLILYIFPGDTLNQSVLQKNIIFSKEKPHFSQRMLWFEEGSKKTSLVKKEISESEDDIREFLILLNFFFEKI